MIEPHSSFTKLIYMYRYGRNKMTHDTLYRVNRNTPYSEKTKYMVNAECIKVITHLLKSSAPPVKVILLHFFPIVSWETPVLTFYCKIIRWRSCLPIHIIQIRINPCIATVAINTNRNISLQHYSFFMTIISGIL